MSVFTGMRKLLDSSKGAFCVLVLFCYLVPATLLCAVGKLDGMSYAALGATLGTLLTAIYCHTRMRTDVSNNNLAISDNQTLGGPPNGQI